MQGGDENPYPIPRDPHAHEQLHAFSGSLQSVGLSKLRNWGQTLGNWGQQPRNWDGNPRTGMETPGIGVGMQELN